MSLLFVSATVIYDASPKHPLSLDDTVFHESDSDKNDLRSQITQNSATLFQYFRENKGQIPNEEICYYSSQPGLGVAFTDKEVIYSLSSDEEISSTTQFKLRFRGANVVEPGAQGVLPHTSNYFLGDNPAEWNTGVKSFAEVIYPELYDGIDLIFRMTSEGLKYEFIVKPGVNPEVIKLSYTGIENLSLGYDGSLIAKTALSSLIDKNLFKQYI